MISKHVTQSDFNCDVTFEDDHKKSKSIFDKFGLVVLKNAFKTSDDSLLQESACVIAYDMCQKLGFHINKNYDPLLNLDNMIKLLETKDRQALGQVQGLISKSLEMASFSLNPNINKFVCLLLGVEKKSLIMESFGGFVPNIPSNTSRLYTYHSEQHWLPYRKNFINIWAALFRGKDIGKGTMWVKPFSHLDQHEFYEYSGYSDVSENPSYMQYDVINDSKYQELGLKVEPADLVLFHQNLLHRSEINESNDVGYLFINRFFDVRHDLTISANMGIRPYSKESAEIGRKLNFSNKVQKTNLG